MSAGKTVGEDSLLAAGKAWGDSEAGVDQQKKQDRMVLLRDHQRAKWVMDSPEVC